MIKTFLVILLAIYNLHSHDHSFKFKGIWGSPVENIQNMNGNTPTFLPYNPIIVEIGAFEGAGTIGLSSMYPYGTIFAFEPHPIAYTHLVEKTRSLKNILAIHSAVSTRNGPAVLYGEGPTASLFPILNPKNGKNQLTVPAVVLDDWCKEVGIDRIDFLRLDAEGLEWPIIESSSNILKSVIVIVTKTNMNSSKSLVLPYSKLKKQLENMGFELLSHWYQEGKEGEATFVRKYMYNSIFR